MRRRLAFLAVLPLVALPASTMIAPAAAQAPVSEHDKLTALFKQSDEESLRRNPLNAMFRGDMRYAGEFGDYITDDYYAAERKASEADLANLARIDRAKLNATDRIAYDVFKYQTEVALRGMAPDLMALNVVRPINHFAGFHTFYPNFASGSGVAPFKTVEDYENNLKRHKGYVVLLDRSIGRFREGMKSGVYESQLTIGNVVAQLDRQLAEAPEKSPFYGPINSLPESFSAADKARLAKAYRAAITDDIYPAYTRLRDFLKTEYLPKARGQVGLSAMTGGDKVYAYLIESTTTLPLKPDEVHQLGLSEVARIKAGMEAIRTEVGFQGTLPQFFEHLRTDPKFRPASADQLRTDFERVGKQVDAGIGTLFAAKPKTPLEIRAVEAFREKEEAAGSYQSGSPDGTRPGVFYYNSYDLPTRSTWGEETLYLHEGAPGHHFQISLAQENEALPAFMRFGGNTAFVEGWALYAETLGPELGLFKDPYQRFGHLNDEMLRAMRLVVDTGLHSKNWSRDQAIEYMLANSGMGRTDATAEVERYIAIPSQALAYKVGALTIQRLKAKAQQALGSRFDPRAFHAQVLDTGALPMGVLEKKIDDWIAAQKG